MRYLLDTNIYIYWATDKAWIDSEVFALLNEPDSLLCISVESVKELIVAYNKKGWGNKRWRTCESMIQSIRKEYLLDILLLDEKIMRTYSRL